MSSMRSTSESCAVFAQGEEAVLNIFGAGAQFFLRKMLAAPAGAVALEQRAVDVVVADIESAHSGVGHVAIGVGDAGAGMDSHIPDFKFGMASLSAKDN